MTTALLLIAFGVFFRLLPVMTPPFSVLGNEVSLFNLVPMGALALYAGARLPKGWAFAAPLIAWIASDLIIDTFVFPGFGRGPLDPTRLTIYGWLIATVAIGTLPRRDAHVATRLSLSLVASSLFFLSSNFAEWAAGSIGYPKTAEGLMTCYAAAVPFFQRTLAADLLGTVGFFGAEALASRLRQSKPATAALEVE